MDVNRKNRVEDGILHLAEHVLVEDPLQHQNHASPLLAVPDVTHTLVGFFHCDHLHRVLQGPQRRTGRVAFHSLSAAFLGSILIACVQQTATVLQRHGGDEAEKRSGQLLGGNAIASDLVVDICGLAHSMNLRAPYCILVASLMDPIMAARIVAVRRKVRLDLNALSGGLRYAASAYPPAAS